MSRNLITWFLVVLISGLYLLGCSGAGDLTSPGTDNGGPIKEATSPDGSAARYLWDIGEVVIDPVAQTVEVFHPRIADVSANVLKFMQPPGGPSSVSYKINWGATNLANGLVDLDMTLKHPFLQNIYWGHDVRLVIIGNGTQAGIYDTSVRYAKTNEMRMLNADGYTRWWNQVEFLGSGTSMFEYKEGELAIGGFVATARVNPYKYFADSVGLSDYPININPNSRGEFRSGNTNKRHMVLQFPKSTVVDWRFKYAVDASWEEAIHTPVDSSDDFSLAANLQEAYQVKVDQTGSTVFYESPSNLGGNLNMNIEIFDWKQGGGTVQGEIARVVIESPTLFGNQGGSIDITNLANITPGSNANSVIYSYTVNNCTPTSQDNQDVLVTVESSAPTSYAPPFGSFPHPNKPLAAYQLYTADVDGGIPPTKTITVITPNGGESWQIGTAQTIFWTSTGAITNVRIEYSEDGGSTYPHTIVDTTANDGNYSWNPVPDTPTDLARVRISEVGNPTVNDVSNNNFSITAEDKTITVTAPNGGESLLIGGSSDITWTSTGTIANVKIEYSNDGGSTFVLPPITASTPNDGLFSWDPIPDDPTDQAIIKVTDASDNTVSDVSNDVFSITATPKNLTVIVPNGGESWLVGSTHAITWSSEGAITNVKIEYYKDDTYSNAVLIVASTANDGTYDWNPVPNDVTATAKVRISDADVPATYDDSNNFFAITDQAPQGWTKTLDGVTITPQPNQGPNVPDICVTNLRVVPGADTRGQVMVANADDLTINMYSDDYSAIVATYDIWLGATWDLDISPYNRMDFPIHWINVIGISNSNAVSPFPQNALNDPAESAMILPLNEEASVNAFGFYLYADGDPEGTIPPDSDPDAEPWLHNTDWDSGVLGGPFGDAVLDDQNVYSLVTYSHHPDQPQVNSSSRLFLHYTQDTYNIDGATIVGLPAMVLGGLTPGYVDDTNPTIMRLAVDDNSLLAVGGFSITTYYILDTAGKVHITMLYYDDVLAQWNYIPFGEDYLGAGGGLGIDFGGTAVDIAMMPAAYTDYAYDDYNWLAVMVDTGDGWVVKVYKLDFIGPDPDNPSTVITEVFTTDPQPGTPSSFDVDSWDYEFHALYDDGGTYKVSVWHYEPVG